MYALSITRTYALGHKFTEINFLFMNYDMGNLGESVRAVFPSRA